jgi:glycogen debranching enzyme
LAVRVPARTGWNFGGSSRPLGLATETVTLVEGTAFVISGTSGDIETGLAHGLFFLDTRLLSAWRLHVDGAPPEPLSHLPGAPFAGTFVGRAPPCEGRADSTVLIVRERFVGHGMREDVVVRNLGPDPLRCTLSLTVEADFADLFEVKEHRVHAVGQRSIAVTPDGLVVERQHRGVTKAARIQAVGWAAHTSGELTAEVTVPPHAEWRSTLQVQPLADGIVGVVDYPSDEPVERTEPSRRLEQWRGRIPVVSADDAAFCQLIARTEQDLGALRIVDPEQPDRVTVAAGAPWFMTVFGRDSLLTAWMALPLDQDLAVGTLRTLAALQGRVVNDRTDEEPGRIMHEVRHGADASRALDGASVYYGSIDATPLFVMLLAEVHRWGVAPAELVDLQPAADRAMRWIEEYGDRDGDGFVEYERRSPSGLVNQGWKDSFDGITFADGTIATPPIALAEVQGYTYAAYLATAELAERAGESEIASRNRARATSLRAAFNRDFWLADEDFFALALDRDKRPVDSIGSNIGHCLWTGIVDDDKAARVAARLVAPDMFTGWGVRTLSTSMGAYNPMSYHNGSVWPHDNAIVVAGLMRYGFLEEAHTITRGLLDSAEAFAGRLPELFCGFDRSEFAAPVPYPSTCSPQAWAAASPLLLLRSLLRLDPDVPQGTVWLAPAMTAELADVALVDVPLGAARVAISVRDADVRLTGLPARHTVTYEARSTHFDDPALR